MRIHESWSNQPARCVYDRCLAVDPRAYFSIRSSGANSTVLNQHGRIRNARKRAHFRADPWASRPSQSRQLPDIHHSDSRHKSNPCNILGNSEDRNLSAESIFLKTIEALHFWKVHSIP
jgi:hypothetical protein